MSLGCRCDHGHGHSSSWGGHTATAAPRRLLRRTQKHLLLLLCRAHARKILDAHVPRGLYRNCPAVLYHLYT
jgi:hypothetical protein